MDDGAELRTIRTHLERAMEALSRLEELGGSDPQGSAGADGSDDDD